MTFQAMGPLNRDNLLKKKEYPYKIPRKKKKNVYWT